MFYNNPDVHYAIKPLLKKDVDKIVCLIEALKLIKKNESSYQTTTILNDVEKYLQEWLNNSESSEKEEITSPKSSSNLPEEVLNFLKDGKEIHTGINELGAKRKKELIALGHFLQGKLSTKEEFEYIKKVLHSYLKTIEQFRSPQPPQ